MGSLYLGFGDGGDGTLFLDGRTLTAGSLSIGQAYSGTTGGVGAIDETGGGSIQVGTLSIQGPSSITLGAADVVQNLYLGAGSSVATTPASNLGVPGYTASEVHVDGGTLTLGADVNLTSSWYSSTIDVRGGGSIDAQGHSLAASQINLGSGAGDSWSLVDRGAIFAQSLAVTGGQIELGASDYIGSQLTIGAGGKVSLAADLSLPGASIGVDQGGVLDAQGHDIVAFGLTLGSSGGPWTLENRGALTTSQLIVQNGDLTLGAGDSTGTLIAGAGAVVTTTAVGNVAPPNPYTSAYVYVGQGTLRLGADLDLVQNSYYGGGLSVFGGGTVDAQGHDIVAGSVELGMWSGPWTLANRGAVVTKDLRVANGEFAMGASDAVTNSIEVGAGGVVRVDRDLVLGGVVSLHDGGVLDLTGGRDFQADQVLLGAGGWSMVDRGSITTQSMTLASGEFDYRAGDSISNSLYVSQGGVFRNLTGAAIDLGSYLSVNGGGTLDMGGQSLSSYFMDLGASYDPGNWSLLNVGTLTAQYLNVNGGAFDLKSGDSTSTLNVNYGAAVTTSDVGNVTGSVSVSGAVSTLSLGADMTLSPSFSGSAAFTLIDGGVLDMGGHALAASYVELGSWYSPGTWSLLNPGMITTQTMVVNGGSLEPQAGSSIGDLTVNYGATVTTAGSGSISNSAYVTGAGSTLKLGADFLTAGTLTVDYDGTVDAQGHDINVGLLNLGPYGGWNLLDRGSITAQSIWVAHGELAMAAGDSVSQTLSIGQGGIFGTAPGHDLSLGYALEIYGGGVYDGGGGNITAPSVTLGTYGAGGWTLQNYNNLTTDYLGVAEGSLDLKPGDAVTGSVFIGADGRIGMAADMTLSGSIQVGDAYSTTGVATLDMNGHGLAAQQMTLGSYYGGGNWSLQNPGRITVGELDVYGQSADATPLVLHPDDQAAIFRLSSGASLATTSASNITGGVSVDGSSLTLGADLKLGSYLAVSSAYYSGAASLDMGGHSVQADSISFSNYYGSFSLANPGTMVANSLALSYDVHLALGADDRLNDVYLYNGASLSTASALNVANSAHIYGSTLTLGADLAVTGSVDVSGSYSENPTGVLDMGGHSLSADALTLGQAFPAGGWSILDRGTIKVNSLYVYGGPALTLGAGDSTSYLALDGVASVTTSIVGNVTGAAYVNGYSTPTLGTDLEVSVLGVGNYNGGAGTIDMNGHAVSADLILLGEPFQAGNWSIANQGRITAGTLWANGGSLALGVDDSAANLTAAAGLSIATSSVDNLTYTANVDGVGTVLTLGADLALQGDLNVTNGGRVDAQGRDVSANGVLVGLNGDSAATLEDVGRLSTAVLWMGHGSELTLTSGQDVVDQQIFLQGDGTTLTVLQAMGQATGLTLNGTDPFASLSIDVGASLVLDFAADAAQGSWIFRWLDGSGGDFVSRIESLIAAGSIRINTSDYQVYDRDGYTYVGYGAVPEPSSIVMAALGAVAIAGWRLGRGRSRAR